MTAILPPSNILLVDDKPENLLAVEEILRHPLRRLWKTTSGNEALRLLLKHEFAVVLLDVQMPEMDGYETAQLMRGDENGKNVPIIFMTAADRSLDRMFRGYEVGAVDYLYKPINPRVLKGKVEVFVQLQRSSADLKRVNHDLVRAEAALQEKLGDLETLNHTLSHDLRAPLRSIHQFSQILLESYRGKLDAEADDHLGRIIGASERMQRMLDGLFGLLRISAADQDFGVVDAAAVLRDLLADLGTDLGQAGAVVTHETLPQVRADATLLRQTFQNLIDNAIKFRGTEPPAIHIGAERLPDAWRFAVRDNGVGIKPEHRQRIFGVFQRLVGQRVPGSGVGLALCKKAVERQGGTIWVEGNSGPGSTFFFTVPLARKG